MKKQVSKLFKERSGRRKNTMLSLRSDCTNLVNIVIMVNGCELAFSLRVEQYSMYECMYTFHEERARAKKLQIASMR